MQVRVVKARRQRVHKAALDNMAGETVSALFATMAERANSTSVDGAEGKGGGGGGSRGDSRNKAGVGTQGSAGEDERRVAHRSGNQGGEEEDGPRREGEGSGGGAGGNQLAEGRHEGEGAETVTEEREAVLGDVARQAGAAPIPDASAQNSIQDPNVEVTRCDMGGYGIMFRKKDGRVCVYIERW